MSYTNILRTIPTISSAALVKENIRVAKKKNLKAKDMVELGTKNIVGSVLITEIAKYSN